tara:strand:- start:10733 stop:11377 length:645 start_codon:yes stop_codon:yes gene_type:complete
MYQLNPASLETTKETLLPKKNTKESVNNTNNRTYKNRKTVNFSQDEKVESNKNKLTNINNLLSKLHDNDDEDEEENNFKEQYEKINSVVNTNSDIINSELQKLNSNVENNIPNTSFLNTNINSKFSNFNDSYKSNLEYLNNMNQKQGYNNNNTGSVTYDNNQLLSKLDYIIHLLEEQHNEKTNHITEELILYLFLGIFIIFVLDSFAKASKYIR